MCRACGVATGCSRNRSVTGRDEPLPCRGPSDRLVIVPRSCPEIRGRLATSASIVTIPVMTGLRLVQNASRPARALPPLIARLGLHDERLLTEFEGFGMSVIGRTIAQAKSDPALARIARDRYGVEVLIDPDNCRNQLPVGDRTKGFQKASFALNGQLDLRRRTLSPQELTTYVRLTLGDLAELRATIFVAPYHLGGGPDCPIRSTDLRLARRAVNAFHSLRLAQPRSGERYPVERRLLAGIAIRPADLLDPTGRRMLVDQYSAIEVSGYLVRIVGLSEDTPIQQVIAAADFVFSLYHRYGRDVILGGGKNLALAFVGAGLPAAMLGIAEGEVFHVATGGRNQGARPIYHSALWRSVAASTPAAAFRAEILFYKNPCECGHHGSRELPANLHALKLHTLTRRLDDFRTVAAWPEGQIELEMRARISEIDEVAAGAGYPGCPAAFVSVVQAAERARRRALRVGESEDE